MADLIARVRDLISDPASGGKFGDVQIQDALDRRRTEVRYEPLHAEETIAPGGAVSYKDFYAPAALGDWEADAQLVDGSYNVLSPNGADYITGHWTFNAAPNRPVYLTGKSYDVYAAAAYLLREWAAKVKLQFDVGTDQERLQRSQKLKMLLGLANEYEGKQRATTIKMVRSDARSTVRYGGQRGFSGR